MNGSFHWPPRDLVDYHRRHRLSLDRRDEFWREQAARLEWEEEGKRVCQEDLREPRLAWFVGGRLRPCRNALERHLAGGAGERPALVYLDHRFELASLSYAELQEQVADTAAALAGSGLEPGARVVAYLPNVPQAVILALATAWLGATHVPVPARFAPEKVADIAGNCQAAQVVVLGDFALGDYRERVARLGEILPAGARGLALGEVPAGFASLQQAPRQQRPQHEVDAEHPLALLYASSATGIPRGSIMASAGLLVQAAAYHQFIFRFDLPAERQAAIYSAVDLASAAGLSHGLWGPLLNGDTVVLAATRTRPAAERLRRLAREFPQLAVLTSPDRLEEWVSGLEQQGPEAGCRFRLLASCQDVLLPRLCRRAAGVLLESPERLLNLWVQNETGTACLATFPRQQLNRPGSLGLALPGVQPRVLNDDGRECPPNQGGRLLFAGSWPALARGIWGQPERFRDLYFNDTPGHFATRDAVRRDRQGFFWFMARRDEVVKVRGISLRTDEIESILQVQSEVQEAAVVGAQDPSGAELMVAFLVAARQVRQVGREIVAEKLASEVSRRLGPLAVPDRFVFCDELPRSGSGKLARRLLRRLASGQLPPEEQPGNLANPQALAGLRQAVEK